MRAFVWFLIIIVSLIGCSGPPQGQSAIDTANIQLNAGNCSAALVNLLPVYNSAATSNAVRLAMASAYGCVAHVKVFNVALDLVSSGGSIAGPGFWEFLVTEFPSTASPDDRMPEAAENAIDAVVAMVSPGAVISASDWISPGPAGFNPGTLLVSERTTDSSTYLPFLGMALMGSLLSRNGNPLPNHQRTTALPWLTPETTPGDGCALASAALHFYDGMTYLGNLSSGSSAAVYKGIASFMGLGLNAACNLGCTVCGGTLSCSTCPITLRDRNSCLGTTTDANSCAAAGIAAFINNSWPGTP